MEHITKTTFRKHLPSAKQKHDRLRIGLVVLLVEDFVSDCFQEIVKSRISSFKQNGL